MTYLSPGLLWLLALLPLQGLAYVWLLHRRTRQLQSTGSRMATTSAASIPGWHRHLPAALLLAASGVSILATARPMARITMPIQQQTVILAIDVSGSMQARDVAPNRIRATQQAAKDFVAMLPRKVRIGLVSYADSAQLMQPPTARREDVLAAIDRLKLRGGTAIGEGIAVALAAIFPERGIDASQFDDSGVARSMLHGGNARAPEPRREPAPVTPGSDRSAAIVLLTDGQNTSGPDPEQVAQLAASLGIKVFTVGYGTMDGEVVDPEGFTVRVHLDEETLKKVAELTRGEYFRAASGTELARVYEGLQGRLRIESQDTEITAVFAGMATLLLLAGAGMSLWWFGKVV